MIPVVFLNAAQNDLREIGDHIAQDNPARSVTFVNELIDKAEAIGYFPRNYPPRDDLKAGLRMAIHGHYKILFHATDFEVLVVRIIHGARDLREIF